MNCFYMTPSGYLSQQVIGYHHQYYLGYNQPGNPDFINVLKNTYNKTGEGALEEAKNSVVKILSQDIPQIMRLNRLDQCMCVCIPRAKAEDTYTDKQLFFKRAVSEAADFLRMYGYGVENGSHVFLRHTNTCTTHLSKAKYQGRKARWGDRTIDIDVNDGNMPYPGITRDTCWIHEQVRGKNVILIDDIYTPGVGIDEDAAQALLEMGAKRVILYTIGFTDFRRRQS